MKNKKVLIDTLVVGFAMFAIFFGAGNLIFPPQIGLVSGTKFVPAIVGICISGVLFPMMAMGAVGNMGLTIEDMMRHVHPKLHLGYMVACIFAICFGTMPRCGGVAYEIGLLGIFPNLPPVSKWIFLLVFFGLAYLVASSRAGFIDTIGKYLTPVLIVTVFIIIVLTIAKPIAPVTDGIVDNAFSNAFVAGINTGDVGTGIICAGIIITALKDKGYRRGKEQKKMLFYVTIVAFILLSAIYGGLCYLGATGTEFFAPDTDNTVLLVGLVRKLAGYGGIVVLSVAIISATFTTASGMIATTADWIVSLSRNCISYKPAVLGLTAVIFLVSSTGVSNVLKISGPLFVLVFPMGVVFTVLGCFKKLIPNDGVWKGSVWVSIVIGFYQAIQTAVGSGLLHLDLSGIDAVMSLVPLSDLGFTWLVPSIVGGIIGGIIWKIGGKESLTDEIDLIIAQEEAAASH